MVEQKKKPDRSRAVGSSNSGLALQASQPVIDILPNLILGNSIALLDFAFELVTTAVDRSEVVVSELTPLLFYLAGQLFPASIEHDPNPLQLSFAMRSPSARGGPGLPVAHDEIGCARTRSRLSVTPTFGDEKRS